MSLTNILETARKMGIPVVITNERGESPQVVVPFEDFAAMVSGSSVHTHAHSESYALEEEDENEEDGFPSEEMKSDWSMDESDEGTYELSPEEIEELDKIIVEEEKGESEPPRKSTSSSSSTEPTSVSLEDQFYFEPVKE